ncbi:MAG: polysaccharide deacetylase family protein [bacterium]
MRDFIKNILYAFLYAARSAADFLFNFREVSVLCYHSISSDGWELSTSPEMFERQLRFLKAHGYHFAALDEISAYAKREGSLLRKCAAVTFDDGYEDLLTHALPILRKYQASAAVFLIAEPEAAGSYLKPGAKMLGEAQLAELAASGLITLAHHSKTHAMLETTGAETLSREIANPKGYRYFAYPGGHYSAEVARAVAKAGFTAAFSIKPGLIAPGDDLFALKRNVITGPMPFWQFALRATKAIEWYRSIVRAF